MKEQNFIVRPELLALGLGAISLALILAVLGFQYLAGILPCEMCHWQRWPHIGAATVGLGGGLLVRSGLLGRSMGSPLAWCTVVLIAASGFLGVYHAGVEWHFWPGPQACTGNAFHFTGGKLDLSAPVVMCDVAAWRLFGISLAGYNALVSLAVAAFGTFVLLGGGKR